MKNNPLNFRAYALLALLTASAWLLWTWGGHWGQINLPEAQDSDGLSGFTEVRIRIPKKGMWRLRLAREIALEKGVLLDMDNPWIGAKVMDGSKEIPAKIRLKGDWTDHLRENKWSFRVEIKDTASAFGLQVFNLQHPKSREYLDEWLFHEVLRLEDLLTTRYDFVRLYINGSNLGIYALEEHFADQLVQSNRRIHGPLFKFQEEGMWEARVKALQDSFFPYMDLPLYPSAHVEAFGFKKGVQDSIWNRQHRNGQILMTRYKEGKASAGQLFDVSRLAAAYALMDVFGAYHGLIWHNRRYYFNPAIQKLEMVVYDAYSGMPETDVEAPFLGYARNSNTQIQNVPGSDLDSYLFRDEGFLRAYYAFLWKFSDPAQLQNWGCSLASEVQKREDYLRQEFWSYRFDWKRFANRASRIRRVLTDSQLGELMVETIEEDLGARDYRIRNRSPLAYDVEGYILQAYDGVNAPDSLELRLEKAPQIKVLGRSDSNK
jgi:hypothetical protein